MLNIFKEKQKNFKDFSLNTKYAEKANKKENKLERDEYKNIIFYPSSSKE